MSHPRFLTAATLGLLAATAAGAGLFALTTSSALHAEEETTAEKVARLLPDLMSDSEDVRMRAERELFALGPAGRTEMERYARDDDAKRAAVAERLLASKRWDARPGEEQVRKARTRDLRIDLDDEDDGGRRRSIDEALRRFREESQKHFAEIEQQLGELGDGLQRDLGGLGEKLRARIGGARKGVMVEDGKRFSWDIAADGKVKVTTKDGDEAEKVYEADDVEKLREAHPDIAKRLDDAGGSAIHIRMPRFDFDFGDRADLRDFFGGLDGRRRDRNRGADTEDDDSFRMDPAAQGPRLGVLQEPAPEVLREQLGFEGGIVIRGVSDGSLAERLGLRRNDVLLTLAGKDIRDGADVRDALESAKDGAEIEAIVLRKGKRETLEATR